MSIEIPFKTKREGKNLIVDGRLDFWYEGVSQTSSGYGSDTMYLNENVGTTKVHTQEALTLGVGIPEVPSAKWFSQTVVTSVAGAGNYDRKAHRIGGVQTSAGKTTVFSFYGKADAAKDVAVEFVQNFGTGGSPSTEVTAIGVTTVTLSTGFVRYDVTVALPNLLGKTLGTNGDDYLGFIIWMDAGSTFDSRTNSLGQQSGTFSLACFQLEDGSEMTDFEEVPLSKSIYQVNRYYQKYSELNFLTYVSGINAWKQPFTLNTSMVSSSPAVNLVATLFGGATLYTVPNISDNVISLGFTSGSTAGRQGFIDGTLTVDARL